MAETLRILGVGDAKSRHFARWANRLAERGHEVHVASGRFNPREGELDGLVVHQFQELDPLLRVPLVRRFRMVPALAGAREARPAGRRPLALPPALRLLDGARRARAARRQPVGEGRDRRRVAVAGGRGAGADRDRAGARARLRRQLAGARGRGGPARRRPREVPPHLLARAHRRLLAGARRPQPLAARSAGPTTRSSASRCATSAPTRTSTSSCGRSRRPDSEVPELRLFSSAGGGWTREEFDRLAAELGVEPYMAVQDVPAAELPSVTASADFAVTLADVDSSPASLLETMASGVPLVVGRAPSMDEWIQQGEGGELVEPPRRRRGGGGDAPARARRRAAPDATASGTCARCTRASATRPRSSSRSTGRCSAGETVLALAFDGARLRPRPAPHGRGEAADHLAARARGRVRAAPLDDPRLHADGLVVVPHRAQPRRPRDLQLHDEPEPRHAEARERREPRRHADLAAARRRRDPLGVRRDPVHVSGRAARRHRRHRLRRPRAAADPARERRGADLRRVSRPRHGAPPDGRALVGGLPRLHRPAARARRPDGRRLQARLRARARPRPPLRRLHEHRPRRPPRLRPLRPGASRARGRPAPATSSCRSTSASTRCAAS